MWEECGTQEGRTEFKPRLGQPKHSVSILRLVCVNNVHICENAVMKREHTMELTDKYHKNNLKPQFYSKLQFNKLLSLSLDIR